jgi:hypothetical protein
MIERSTNLRVERVDFLQLLITIVEERFVEIGEMSLEDLLLDAFDSGRLLDCLVEHRFHFLSKEKQNSP